jgi:dCTP deaminase
MQLTKREIQGLMETGQIRISPAPDAKAFQPASVDLRLGYSFLGVQNMNPINVRHPDPSQWKRVDVPMGQFVMLAPGEFVLGSTIEHVKLGSRVAAQIADKSTLARCGIQLYMGAGFVDPGFDGTLTLEIKNNSITPVQIYPGDYVCQIIFNALSSDAELYKGKYAGQDVPVPAIGRPKLDIV